MFRFFAQSASWINALCCFCSTTAAACSYDQFRCTGGQCISGYLYCDLFPDCPDGSDESNCTGKKVHAVRVRESCTGDKKAIHMRWDVVVRNCCAGE